MKLSMNVTSTFYGTVVNDIAIAKQAGFTGIELQNPKLDRYLAAGFNPESVLPLLDGLPVSGFGALQESDDDSFRAEAERLATLGQLYGAPSLQMCTGPVDVQVVKDFHAGLLSDDDPRYRGLLESARTSSLPAPPSASGWPPTSRPTMALASIWSRSAGRRCTRWTRPCAFWRSPSVPTSGSPWTSGIAGSPAPRRTTSHGSIPPSSMPCTSVTGSRFPPGRFLTRVLRAMCGQVGVPSPSRSGWTR